MRLALGWLVLVSLSGCATTEGVRYVYQDGEFGVVGIPENTDRWPTHYRKQADDLIKAHFPEGHEIIRAEEVVEGARILKVEGKTTAEVAPQLPIALIDALKVGHTASHSRSDAVNIKECRIIYRRAGGRCESEGYASAASPTPTLYVDPNVAERRKMVEKPKDDKEKAKLLTEKEDKAKKADDND